MIPRFTCAALLFSRGYTKGSQYPLSSRDLMKSRKSAPGAVFPRRIAAGGRSERRENGLWAAVFAREKKRKSGFQRPIPASPQCFSRVRSAKVLNTHIPPGLSGAKGRNPSFWCFSLAGRRFPSENTGKVRKTRTALRPFRTVRRPVFRAPHRTKRSVGRSSLHPLLPVPQLIFDELFKRFSIPTFPGSFTKRRAMPRRFHGMLCAAGFFPCNPA